MSASRIDQTATYLNVSCRIWPCPGPPHSERIVLYLGGPGAGQARQEANVSQRIPLYRVLVLAPGAWKSDVSHVSWCISALHGEGSRERIQTYPVVSCAGSGLACWTYLNVSWGIWWKRFAPRILFEPLTIRPQTSNRGPLPIQK